LSNPLLSLWEIKSGCIDVDRFKVSAVVHGHAHHGRYEGHTPRGAPVYNVAFSVEKSTGRPYALIKV
jgi:Icc-related predicted phosphoesterase